MTPSTPPSSWSTTPGRQRRPSTARSCAAPSGDVHAWGDSNLYLPKSKDHWLLSAEHRSHHPTADLHLRIAEQPARLVIDTHPLAEGIRAALADGPLTRRALRDRLGIRAESLGEAVHQLLQEAQLRVVGDKLDLP